MNSRIKPDLFHYSLLLKTVKDCGVGDQAFVNDILLECMSNSEARKFGKALLENQQKPRLTEGGEHPVTGGKDESSIETEKRELEILPATSNGEISAKHLTKANNQLQPQLPNLLMAKPNFKNVVSLGALRTAEDRFQLIGGVDGFFQLTHSRGVQCNARMVTLMLDLIENSEEAELKLLDKAKEMKVTLDISFFNKLITRRAFR